jgi:hypothetical protein
MHPTLQKAFDQSQVLKVISGLHNFDAKSVAATVKAADRGGATFVDIAADPDLVTVGSPIDKYANLCIRRGTRSVCYCR